jgi:tRNA-Thr(GGU) m(6)t(6)A37 methyltransferase TsaA
VIAEPIGIYKTGLNYKYELPRQGFLHTENPGRIELFSGRGFEQALRDLEGFERIWVVFHFHENAHWRPTVRPPVPPADHERVGVFASRSPYRPNPIGLSCVKLLNVSGLTLWIDEADMLNETPVLDIKPYIPKADAFPQAKAGWVDAQTGGAWNITLSETFRMQNEWIENAQHLSPAHFAGVQLRENPFDGKQKRVRRLSETQGILAYRTFRLHFSILQPAEIILEYIQSAYTPEDLENPEDLYGDKETHRKFQTIWPRK